MNQTQRCIIGAFVIRAMSGAQQLQIATHQYLVSSFYLYDLTTTDDTMEDFSFLSEIFTALFLMLSVMLEQRFGFKRVIATAMIVLGIGIYLSTFTIDVYIFMMVYSLCTGLCNGLTMVLVVWPIINIYPDHKAKLLAFSGIAYTIGLFPIFALVTAAQNKNYTEPELLRGYYYYRGGILRDFRMNFEIYACFLLVAGFLATMLVKKNIGNEKTDIEKGFKLKIFEIIKIKRFWVTVLVYFFLTCYKQYYSINYYYVSLEESMAIAVAFVNMVSLALIGLCYDRFKYNWVSSVYLGLMILHSLLYYLGQDSEGLFKFCYCLFSFSTVPIYIMIIMMINSVLPSYEKEAFSISAAAALVGNFISEMIGNAINSGSPVGEFMLLASLPVISIFLIYLSEKLFANHKLSSI